jgi:hypothetical protein
MGLNESFSQVRGQILLMDPLPSINKVFSLVIQEERQREVALSYSLPVEHIALISKIDINSQGKPYKPQSTSRRERLTYTHCGLLGHVVDKCYKLHGYPLGYKNNKNRIHNHSTHQVQESSSKDFTIQSMSLLCLSLRSSVSNY